MTPNERKILERIQRSSETDIVTVSKELNLSLDYTKELCQNLVNKDFLEEITSEKYPVTVYKIKELGGSQKNGYSRQFHSFWYKLMDYVKENGGHLKMSIRFKDGLPVEAEDIKKKVRFD